VEGSYFGVRKGTILSIR